MGSGLRSVVFAYHDIGIACLDELLRTGDQVALVVTHDDRPDEKVWFGSVREFARARGLPVIAPADVNAPEVVERIRACEPHFLFSFMFRQLLSRELLDVARRGALNLHPSALPKFRGRCPINWVLIEGERETGVTLHYMVEKPDRGDIVGQRCFPIGEEDTALTLHRRATEEARLLFREVYPMLREGRAARIPQDPSQASYYGGRRPEDGKIDWNWPARRIYNLVRAVTHPYPGAFTTRGGQKIFVWWAVPLAEGTLPPGVLCWAPDVGVLVGAGRGSLRLVRVQTEGWDELPAEEWARISGVRSGERLGDQA